MELVCLCAERLGPRAPTGGLGIGTVLSVTAFLVIIGVLAGVNLSVGF
jgi:hypothetical protein